MKALLHETVAVPMGIESEFRLDWMVKNFLPNAIQNLKVL